MRSFLPFFGVGLTFLVFSAPSTFASQIYKPAEEAPKNCESNLANALLDRASARATDDLDSLKKSFSAQIRKLPVYVPPILIVRFENELKDLRELLVDRERAKADIAVVEKDLTELTNSILSHPMNREIIQQNSNYSAQAFSQLNMFKYLLNASPAELKDYVPFYIAKTAEMNAQITNAALLKQIREATHYVNVIQERKNDINRIAQLKRTGLRISNLEDLKKQQKELQVKIQTAYKEGFANVTLPDSVTELIQRTADRVAKSQNTFDLRLENWLVEKSLRDSEKKPLGAAWRLGVIVDQAEKLGAVSAASAADAIALAVKKENRGRLLKPEALENIRDFEVDLADVNLLIRSLAL